MRLGNRHFGIGALVVSAGLFTAGQARAQADTVPPLPNVMLLVDTSGSMEFMVEPDSNGKPKLPVCNPGAWLQPNEQNRWATVVSVLTGEFNNYSCYRQDRSTTAFRDDYQVGSTALYDAGYYLPHTRMVSGSCVLAPNTSAWPVSGGNGYWHYPDGNAIREHRYNNPSGACTSNVDQVNDGLLDAFATRARFGLMTFDTLTNRRTGISGGGFNNNQGAQGQWSYYPDWTSNSNNYAKGKPELCAVNSAVEVGARNPIAPPWEGRLLAFGDYADDPTNLAKHNRRVQEALLTARPYGATPIAGMLSDAEYFMNVDPSPNLDPDSPGAPNQKFGPKDDPYRGGGCRDNFIILLTDGQPNLDLRPSCENTSVSPPGKCPYDKPADIAYRMAHPTNVNLGVKTYVIGFAVSEADDPTSPGSKIDCEKLTPPGSSTFDPTGLCANPNKGKELAVCCELGEIAYAGGTENPFFAKSKLALRTALSKILGQVSDKTTTRTYPAFGGVPSGSSSAIATSNAPAAGYSFLSSFTVDPGNLWQGVLERQRYQCISSGGAKEAKLQPIDATKGDDFSANLETNNPERFFYSVRAQPPSGGIDSTASIRGSSSISDGVGGITHTMVSGSKSSIRPKITPNMMALNLGGGVSKCSSSEETLSPGQCRNRVLGYSFGDSIVTGTTPPQTFKRNSLMGTIFHATPTVVPPPSEFIRDESYAAFQAQQATNKRPTMLYTATTDGQLHAFKVAPAAATDTLKVDSKVNNELWSFMPPAVLPGLEGLFGGVEVNLLDGVSVVRDVVLAKSGAGALAANAQWSTQLVAGFGPSRGGYYALDVTNPIPGTINGSPSGPVFRWQLTKDGENNPLFGAASATPAITTLYFKAPGETEAKEIAVAILPGGAQSKPLTQPGSINRAASTWPQIGTNTQPNMQVPAYNQTDPALSVTVVRLDTGEVIRTFRRSISGMASGIGPRATITPFDAPMTGTPVPYPSGAGKIANRAYIGDSIGDLWRMDFSSPDPTKWRTEMVFDAYNQAKFPATVQRSPVATPPVLSVDAFGNIVVIFSTGDQETFTEKPGMRTVAWSVREIPNLTGGVNPFKMEANWHLGTGETIANTPTDVSTNWTDGERITGPMVIFNGILYFSTFRPRSNNDPVCEPGQSSLWAVDFIERNGGSATLAGPKGRLRLDPNIALNQIPPAQHFSDSIIFGVGLTRTPACGDTTSFSDPYLGFGSASSISNMNPGKFQLVVQTGNKGTPSSGKTNRATFDLPTPPPTVRIDSWAAIVE